MPKFLALAWITALSFSWLAWMSWLDPGFWKVLAAAVATNVALFLTFAAAATLIEPPR